MKKSRRKALGQHFLIDRNVLKKIIKTIDPQPQDVIIEIGPGKGILTFPLADKAGKVIAIEKDKAFVPLLRRKNIPDLVILEEDILKVNLKSIIEHEIAEEAMVKIVGNLPYSISSPLLFKLFSEKDLFSGWVFLLQKEFALRMCAKPGTKKFAPLSILFQVYFSVTLHRTIPPEAFSPPPQVESALVSFKKRRSPLFSIKDDSAFLNFLRGAFRHRRKTLFNNLQRAGIPSLHIERALQELKIEKDLRPEQLTISQFTAFYHLFYPETSIKKTE